MQQLQATPIQSNPQVHPHPLPEETRGPDIVLPPPQFNLGQPLATLLHVPRNEIPLVPQPLAYSRQLSSHSDLSAGILFVHSDLGQNKEWRDQFTAQFYRSPTQFHDIQPRPQLPQLSPRPVAPNMGQQPLDEVPPHRVSQLGSEPNIQNMGGTGNLGR
jgi:hypothetical protein